MDIAAAVSAAIKTHSKYVRQDVARKFARKMRAHAERIRTWGTGGHANDGRLTRSIVNAMCWGVGDEHNVKMIRRYEEAAKAADRFVVAGRRVR